MPPCQASNQVLGRDHAASRAGRGALTSVATVSGTADMMSPVSLKVLTSWAPAEVKAGAAFAWPAAAVSSARGSGTAPSAVGPFSGRCLLGSDSWTQHISVGRVLMCLILHNGDVIHANVLTLSQSIHAAGAAHTNEVGAASSFPYTENGSKNQKGHAKMCTLKPRPSFRLGGNRLAGGGIAAASASSLAASLRAPLPPPFLKCGSLAWRMRFISSGDSLAAFLAAACRVQDLSALYSARLRRRHRGSRHNRAPGH